MKEGVVIKSTGNLFLVMDDKGETHSCKLQGKFRIKDIKTTNPVAVGDRVIFDLIAEENAGFVTKILPRHNYIIRRATKLSKVSHIIAANIDQVCIVVTLAHPRTSCGFIDRISITAEAYHIPVKLLFNKIDLFDDSQMEELDQMIKIYESVGYPCYKLSAIRGDGLDELKSILRDKQSVITGHSGVGKTALLNALQPELNLKTGDLSAYHKVGMHTTTFAVMHPLSFGGFIIDTPGIKEFGLTAFKRTEIAERFPEIRKFMHGCHFTNCSHVHEPNCAVIDAVERGDISISRYESYLSILTDDYWEKTEKDYRTK